MKIIEPSCVSFYSAFLAGNRGSQSVESTNPGSLQRGPVLGLNRAIANPSILQRSPSKLMVLFLVETASPKTGMVDQDHVRDFGRKVLPGVALLRDQHGKAFLEHAEDI